MALTHFNDLSMERPTADGIRQQYQQLQAGLDAAVSTEEKLALIRQWDAARRKLDTWSSLVYVRFSQDTRNEVTKADRDYADALLPELTECSVNLKKQLLADTDRPALEAHLGRHVFDLWQFDVDAFEPIIKTDLEQEAKLTAAYTELCASAEIPFDGKTHNLSSLRAYLDDADREKRHRANQLYWGFFERHREQLDTLFDQLVQLRHNMAQKLGFDTYTPLGYRQMQRLDYDEKDVASYREQVVNDIVPICEQIFQRRREKLGLDTLFFWDEGIADKQGNPSSPASAEMVPAAQRLFERTHPELGRFFAMMTEKGLIDLDARPGKAGGGYCTFLPTAGWPFIFCNSNGSMDDAVTLIHEIGHAFQAYSSKDVPIIDLQWPTSESAEIHSMSLEFLTFPASDELFGPEAERYQRIHLEKSLLFLPYGVAVDHFQHLVYANPSATPAQRHKMWQEMEQLYMPWRQYGDLKGLTAGQLWQQKQHIYCSPFYYIDYTLAQCCALQFWVKSGQHFDQAMADYVALCQKGGTASFSKLVASAGLVSPFEKGALKDVAIQVKSVLQLDS